MLETMCPLTPALTSPLATGWGVLKYALSPAPPQCSTPNSLQTHRVKDQLPPTTVFRSTPSALKSPVLDSIYTGSGEPSVSAVFTRCAAAHWRAARIF